MFLSIVFFLLSLYSVIESERNFYSGRVKRSIEIKKNFNYSNPVKFYFSKELHNVTLIRKALKHLEHYTCLTFKEVKNEPQRDGIIFKLMDKLSVNKDRYMDKLSSVHVTKECLRKLGCIKHMIGHAFGLNHETARYDRDKYIKINWDKIENKSKSIFKKDNSYNTRIFNTAFDYGSIMMPRVTYGTKDRQKAYEVLGSPYYEFMVGQKVEYSHNDLKKINDVYCGGRCGKKVRGCKNGGYPSPDCGVCKCPNGYAGKTCTELSGSYGPCGKTNLFATKNKKMLLIKGNAKCVIAINSRSRTNVAIVVENLKTENITPCVENNGLEIKYRHDKGATGLVLCGSHKNVTVPPTFSQVLLIFYGTDNDHEVKLTYQQVERN